MRLSKKEILIIHELAVNSRVSLIRQSFYLPQLASPYFIGADRSQKQFLEVSSKYLLHFDFENRMVF